MTRDEFDRANDDISLRATDRVTMYGETAERCVIQRGCRWNLYRNWDINGRFGRIKCVYRKYRNEQDSFYWHELSIFRTCNILKWQVSRIFHVANTLNYMVDNGFLNTHTHTHKYIYKYLLIEYMNGIYIFFILKNNLLKKQKIKKSWCWLMNLLKINPRLNLIKNTLCTTQIEQ